MYVDIYILGEQKRTRVCNGGDCIGSNDDIRICNKGPCIKGNWNDWSSWTTCSQSCNNGRMTRRRTCIGGNNNTFTLIH